MNGNDAQAMPLALINAAAGSDDKNDSRAEIETLFAQAGCAIRVRRVTPDAIDEQVEQALAEGCRLIVAGGGDGTLSTVAALLADREAALGVLPLGTLNHFAKDLGISLDLRSAVRTIAAGHTAQIDVGEVNGRTFINNSSIGLYPDMVRLRERLKLGKWLAAGLATARVLVRNSSIGVRMGIDGEQRLRRTRFVFIGNNPYALEGLAMGSRSSLQDGVLSLYTAHDSGKLDVLRFVSRALVGRLRDAEDFEARTATRIDIDVPRHRVAVAIDGEVCKLDTPLHYRIRPGALRVLVPEPE